MLSGFDALIRTELRSLMRERVSLFWIFLFPIVFLGMMMIASGSGSTLSPVAIEVVDHDRSEASRDYLAAVGRVFASGDPVSGKLVADSGRVPVAAGRVRVTVPKGFGADAARGAPVAVRVEYDRNGEIGTQVAARVFGPVTIAYNAKLAKASMPVRVEVSGRVAPRLIDFSQYLLTGVLVVAMMSAAISSTCVAIATRREQNTFKLMACLPLGPLSYLAALILARVIVLFIASALLLAFGRWVLGIGMPLTLTALATATVLTCVGAAAMISLGAMMAARISAAPVAIFLSNIVYLGLLMLSDLTIPLRGVPDQIRQLLSYLPTSQLVAGLRSALVQGQDLSHQGGVLLILSAWTVLFLTVARVTFRWHRV
jgi:ABC-2 type transport system permease protein